MLESRGLRAWAEWPGMRAGRASPLPALLLVVLFTAGSGPVRSAEPMPRPVSVSVSVSERAQEPLGGLRLPGLFGPACAAIAYRPVPVYEGVQGRRLGRLVLDHPERVQATTPSCEAPPLAQLESLDGTAPQPVLTLEVSYEEPALAVLRQERQAGERWYQGLANGRTFWIRSLDAPGHEYLDFEADLVQGVAEIQEACSPDGRCRPLAPALVALIRRAGAAREDSCYGAAYELEPGPGELKRLRLPGGRWVYRMRLADSLRPAYTGRLPTELLVPSRDAHGRWVGYFFSRGC